MGLRLSEIGIQSWKMPKKYDVQEIVFAIPSADAKTRRDILKICNEANCKMKVVPGMYQLFNEEVSVSNLREVSIVRSAWKRYY